MADHSGHRERLRGEFMARPESFPDHKLLELLLFYALPRQDTNPIAHELLERFGTIRSLLDAEPAALTQVSGVGDRAAVLFRAVKELGKRYHTQRCDVKDTVRNTRDAEEIMRPYFYGARNEMVYLLCLDGKGKILACPKISEGHVSAAEVVTRKVVDAALRSNAASAILAHNHVSGLALPSAEDQATTVHLQEILEKVEVNLLDHLVFCDDDMVSMRDSGYMGLR